MTIVIQWKTANNSAQVSVPDLDTQNHSNWERDVLGMTCLS